ncbi:hypothetical protein OG535_40500 [Kitasatospora sp. NBC_00085]|uniref:hypothetical protein n=1 Tax=unclassified Kitasatospora TaxID=2633591 RepID=UPI00324680BF
MQQPTRARWPGPGPIDPRLPADDAAAFVSRLQDTTNQVRFMLESSAEALWFPDGRWSDFQMAESSKETG